jgi:hypothetical protein
MPAMVRPLGKAKKIAYKILGTPPSFQGKRNKKLEKQIFFQDTWRVK